MRLFVYFMMSVLLCGMAEAQIPRMISYQGIVRDAAGNLLSDGDHTFRLKIYTAATGGTEIFAETQNVVVDKGLFNILIGAASGGIPESIGFDGPVFLGITVDGSIELEPRTQLTAAPYALRATVADALAPGAPGIVTSLNGEGGALTLRGGGTTTINSSGDTITISSATAGVTSLNGRGGALTLRGGGATTINSSGDTITISSTAGTGGTGIQGIQNTDGTIAITNPNGPVATIRLANGVIPTSLPPTGAAGGDLAGSYPNPTVARLQGRSVSSTAPSNLQVLKFNGSVWTPASDDAGPWSTNGTNINNINNGNVGIGTSSPATKLEVNGTTRTRDLQITAGAASGRTLVSNASGTAVWTTDMKIVGGNVGIGDTTPKGKLHVAAGSSGFDPTFVRSMVLEEDGHLTLSLRGPADFDQSILFERPPGDTGLTISCKPDGDMRIGRFRFTDNGSASSSFHLFLDVQTGNFGVGRDPVSNDLEVEGTASKTAAGNWLANSDRRIKTDIGDVTGSFETLLALRPVRFRYTPEWRRRHPSIEDRYYHNFIAQEYRQVFPDAVKGSGEFLDGDSSEILQIDTYDAQVVTIKAVQELIVENDALRREIAGVQSRLQSLEAEMATLRALVGTMSSSRTASAEK